MTDLCHLIYWEKAPTDSRREHASSVNTIMVPKKHAMTVARKIANTGDLCGYEPVNKREAGYQPAVGDVLIRYPSGRHRNVWPA